MKPRENDNVEKVDNTRTFGLVLKIIDEDIVRVRWADSLMPKLTNEKIVDLALVRRVRQ